MTPAGEIRILSLVLFDGFVRESGTAGLPNLKCIAAYTMCTCVANVPQNFAKVAYAPTRIFKRFQLTFECFVLARSFASRFTVVSLQT